jgi:hypothetical protein
MARLSVIGSMSRFGRLFFASLIVLANPYVVHVHATEALLSSQKQHAAQSTVQPTTVDAACSALQQAAAENGLPFDFFARVIWQESRFDATAVSAKGAEGIAQFMPQTAKWHGLANPFDTIAALHHSATYLRELRDRFGNLGLAAAAYNAGAGRVKDWIAGRRGLPRETLSYVLIVTGRPAADWVDKRPESVFAVSKVVPCSLLAKSFIASTISRSDKNLSDKGKPGNVTPAWGVQLVGSSSESAAMASFQQLQKANRNILGARPPVLLQSRVGTTGHWYRVRIATNTRTEAEQLCSGLRAAGRDCLVQRN